MLKQGNNELIEEINGAFKKANSGPVIKPANNANPVKQGSRRYNRLFEPSESVNIHSIVTDFKQSTLAEKKVMQFYLFQVWH